MQIKEIQNKNEWEAGCQMCQYKTFLQSWNWGNFQKDIGNKIWRFGLYKDDQLVAVFMAIKISAKRGKFLFLPHGPLIISDKNNFANLRLILNFLKDLAKQEKCWFLRVAPIFESTEQYRQFFNNFGFRPSPIHMHPELTWELEISEKEDDILSQARKTTRYLIKQGLKNQDLTIEKSEKIDAVKIFNEIYQATAQRHHFTPFSLRYLEKEFLAFHPDKQAIVFLAQYKNEYIAASMVIFWQGTGFYHQGASSQKYPNIPASYVLQWEAIKEAKTRGCSLYNFWGVSPTNNKKHPWYGLSLFKMGFGGYAREYLKTQDLPLSFLYWLSFFIETARRKKRNL